ncbi:MAG: hypothetical protein M3076_18225 [Actinomycetota bacterium]|nr:hypothetical protein [Actinomycetota bacterium]
MPSSAIVSSTSSTGERAARTYRGLAESAQVQPDDVTFGAEFPPLETPHPTIGDARMDEHDGQLTAGARTVIRDTGRRMRGFGHAVSS